MAATRVNIATALDLVQIFLFLAFILTSVVAKNERVDHGIYLELSDLISNIEKRLNDPSFDSNVFDKQKPPSSLESNDRSSLLTSRVGTQEKRSNTCLEKVTEGSIIRATDSLKNGAEFLDSFKGTESNSKCQEYCCKNSSCDVAVYQDKGDRYCYLFRCEDKCLFKDHGGYLVNTITHQGGQSGENSEDISGNENDLESLSGGRTGGSGRAGIIGNTHQKMQSQGDSADGSYGETKKTSSSDGPRSEPESERLVPTPVEEEPHGPVISQHSVSLSGYCTQDIQCEDTNAACLSNNCRCRSGFYDKEGLCRTVCPPSKFECFELGTISRGPECVPKTQVCDSYMQCADGSDEFNCETAASPQQGRGWNNQNTGSYSSGMGGSISQPLLQQQQARANIQAQQLQRQQPQLQQPLAGSLSQTAVQGDIRQQQVGDVSPKQSPQQIEQVGPNSGRQQPSASSSTSTSMSGARTNSVLPVALANTIDNPGAQGPGQSPPMPIANSNHKGRQDKLTPDYSKSMQTNNKLLPYPTNPNNYQPQTGNVANLPPPAMQQSPDFQGQASAASSGARPSVGMPVMNQKTLPQNQMPRIKPSKPIGQNAPPVFSKQAGNAVIGSSGGSPRPQVNGQGPISAGNRMGPVDVASHNGLSNSSPQSSSFSKAKSQSGNGRLQPSQPGFKTTKPGQPISPVALAADQLSSKGQSDGLVKPVGGSASELGTAEANREQALSGKLAPHLQHTQQRQQQHSQIKTNRNKLNQGGKQPEGDYNSQQWVDSSAYLPYNYGGSGSASSRNQQQQIQQTMGSGGYFDPVSARYYPGGGYGQVPRVGYGQDKFPSSFFGNTASADEFSQFGGQYVPQSKSLGSNNYLSGRYPDMAGYDGSPAASSSSQYLQPGAGSGGGYDFDGEFRSPHSYQDLEFYSPMSSQQGFKSGPPSQSSYKAENSGYKSSYDSRPDFPSVPMSGKPKTDHKEIGQSSKSKSEDVKSSKPTPMSLSKPSAAPTKAHGKFGPEGVNLAKNKPSSPKPSVGHKSTTTTQKALTGERPSQTQSHKFENSGNDGAKHLFVSSSREKVIIASPGGGNAEGPIVALSLGLALTLVLLVMVACRLRGFKHRLSKGRPLNQNEADYLINGMYL
ncbi:low-density lipoprotein receptor-related protein 11 [Elysia marginata]|uniref:Low-density lipoprotein receptor-related protein 11 n=1 Tax=Elysia marginata TaxID=1093978 RepID=A0AAV4HNX9_9GAST|nr:low-density lipoprotein receptor-related protein 11 [Elysia marginata]